MSPWHFVPGLLLCIKVTAANWSQVLTCDTNVVWGLILRNKWQISAQQVVYNIWTTCLQLREKRWQHINVALLASRLLFGLIVREICEPSSWNTESTCWSRCNLLAADLLLARPVIVPAQFFSFSRFVCLYFRCTSAVLCRTAAPHGFIFFLQGDSLVFV